MSKTIKYSLVGSLIILALGAALFFATSTTSPPSDEPQTTEQAPDVATTAELPPASITGRVSRSDGAPIAGALVRAGEHETTSDQDGVFSFASLGQGSWAIDASAEGYISPGPAQARAKLVEITSDDAPVTKVDLVLREPARIQGKITAAGQPIPDAKITLYYLFADGIAGPLEPFAIDASSTSSAEGSYDTASIAPGRLRLLVEADGYALAESRELLLTEGETDARLDVDLAPSGALSINAVDTSGNPLIAELVIQPPGGARALRQRTPNTGELVLPNLPLGQLAVTASAPGFMTETFEVTTQLDELASLDIVLEPAGGLFGQVQDKQGKPWPNIPLLLTGSNGQTKLLRTDARGQFQWDAPAGVWSAVAYSPRHAPSPATQLEPSRTSLITLGDGGSIAGRVLTRRGDPVQSYRLAVEDFEVDGPAYHNQRYFGTQQTNSSDGSFTLGTLRPGKYYVRVQPDGFSSALSGAIVVREGVTTDNITITVDAGGVVRGTVRAKETGAPLAGVRVSLFEPMSPFRGAMTRTDADGNYSITGVSPGRRSVRVWSKGYMTQVAAGVQVFPDQETIRDITLEKSSPKARFSFHGIGAVLNKTDKGVVIQQTMEGSPASVFGLQEGDVIVGIDGEDAREMRLTDVVNRIRGEEGAAVSIKIDRDGQGEMIVDVERGRVVVKDNQRRRN